MRRATRLQAQGTRNVTQRADIDFATTYRARQRTIENSYQRRGTARRRGPILIAAAAILIIGGGAGAYFLGGTGTPELDTTVTGAIDPALAELGQFEGL
jgi:hypothetical protein